VLGGRLEERFVLADALHVVARERGARSWPALVAQARRGSLVSALEEVLDDDSHAEIEVETGLAYPDGSPVVITVRQRGSRYLLEDTGEAVRRAGRRRGWEEVAERTVRRSGMNVSRVTGSVFVPAVRGRDLDDLAKRAAQGSLDVFDALLELD
jgi:hypothetical protein